MDKRLWLEVIRKELELLDKLATGMMEESRLEQEEIELAITRSSLVTKEFELLLRQTGEIIVQKKEAGEVNPISPLGQDEVAFPSEAVAVPDLHAKDIENEEDAAVKEKVKFSDNTGNAGQETLAESHPEQLPTTNQPSDQVFIPEVIAVVENASEVPVTPNDAPLSEVKSPVSSQTEPLSYRSASIEYFALEKEERKTDTPLFKPTPIKSLKDGLTLNDRYLFQRELFNNDKIKLDEAIAALDRLASIQEAVGYLKANYRWTKNEASEKFVLLVKRRFLDKG